MKSFEIMHNWQRVCSTKAILLENRGIEISTKLLFLVCLKPPHITQRDPHSFFEKSIAQNVGHKKERKKEKSSNLQHKNAVNLQKPIFQLLSSKF